MMKVYTSIRQGLPTRRKFEKSLIMKRILENSLKTNFLDILTPHNAFYRLNEMQMYFHALIAEHGSGNHASELVFDKYRFNLPDQQTVRVRCEKLDLELMEQVVNHNLRKFAMGLPTYKSGFNSPKSRASPPQNAVLKSPSNANDSENEMSTPIGSISRNRFYLATKLQQKND